MVSIRNQRTAIKYYSNLCLKNWQIKKNEKIYYTKSKNKKENMIRIMF